MATNTKKISELASASGGAAADKILFIANTSNTAVTRTITIGNLLGNSSANVVIQSVTPANSSVTVKQGTIMYDDDYLYVATANNTWKRLTLSSF